MDITNKNITNENYSKQMDETQKIIKINNEINNLELKLKIKNHKNKKHIQFLNNLLAESSNNYYTIISNLSPPKNNNIAQ